MSKVSVLLAVYNCSEFLPEAINSVLSQTYENWELIIVDNGSEDSTSKIAELYSSRDIRIRNFRLEEKGKNRAYNHAYAMSTGQLICYFAGDDILDDNSLEKRVHALSLGDFDFSTCSMQTISGLKKFKGAVFPKNKNSMNFSGGSVLFSRQLANTIFPIPEILPNEDTWTMLHLRALGKGKSVPDVLYHYRIHFKNSYGYELPYLEKRKRFLERMNAYNLFSEKYGDSHGAYFSKYLSDYILALKFFNSGLSWRLLSLNHIPLRERMVLIYFSSPLLYFIRNKYFKLLSGLMG